MLLRQVCDIEVERHGTNSSINIREFGNLAMDHYLRKPGPEHLLWQAFTAANSVCRGAYLQLYFDAHRADLRQRWQKGKNRFSSRDRTRLMRLIYAREATQFHELVFELLSSDPSVEVRETAGLALSIFPIKKDHVGPLRRIIGQESDPDVLSSIVLALKFDEGDPSNELIEEFSNTQHLSVGQALITILATSNLADKRNRLGHLAKSTQPEIALSAKAALQHLQSKDRLSLSVTGIRTARPSSTAFQPELQKQLLAALLQERFTTAAGLIAKGARLDIGTYPNTSMLHLLAQRGPVPSIKWILEQGLDLETKANDGRTALMYVATSAMPGWEDRTQTLVDLGANIQATNGIGETALHIAARLNRVNQALFLLSLNADRNARDDSGRTPMGTATLLGHDQLIKILKP